MKLSLIFALILITMTANAASKNAFECTNQQNANEVATLTYMSDGSGNILWDEPWHSATSLAEANSSEEFGVIYELIDFQSDVDGAGFQLIVSHELDKSRRQGTVEIFYTGQSQGVYNCK